MSANDTILDLKERMSRSIIGQEHIAGRVIIFATDRPIGYSLTSGDHR